MLTQLQNLRFCIKAKLGQRGAEMVEYAIVLACIAAVGIYFYSVNSTGEGTNTLYNVLKKLWGDVANNASGTAQKS